MSFLTEVLNTPEKLYSFVGAAAAISIPLFVNLFKDLWFDYQKRRQERDYIAVQLVHILDKFVGDCSETSWDFGYDSNFPEPAPHDFTAQTEDPIFNLSDAKGEHKFLGIKIIYKLHGINIAILKAKNNLHEITNRFDYGYDDISYYYQQRRREFAKVGIVAANISDELRKRFGIPKHEGWNPREMIEGSLNQMNRQRALNRIRLMERKARRVMRAEKT